MVSGPDIITYIGVPLAVLGVLPIIFNTISTLATLAKVRRMLRHGRLAGIARGDVVNHVIEIELPRYTIAPLDREEQRSKYWRLAEYQSHIPGGTWTTFNWRKHNTGSKTQRIDYSDQLRQPQAEIGFEELISFLLGLGAVPDPAGFRMLRGSGLWVPIGTPLLLSPDRHEAVLTIAPLDDSDGRLSLAVRWSSKWGMRDPSSLPPYWVILRGALDGDIFIEKCTVKNFQEVTAAFKAEHSVEPTDESKYAATEIDSERASISKCMSFDIEHPSTLKVNLATGQHTPVIRCHIGVTGLKTAMPHDLDLVEPLPIDHLRGEEMRVHSTGDWFASALTALSTSSQTMLWNYKVPTAIFAFSQRDSIPCGVLVLLCIIDESATPEWATKYNDEEEEHETMMRKLRESPRAMMREISLSPAEKAKAFRERVSREHDEWFDGLNAIRRRDEQRANTRIVEAVQSPKWNNKLVAEHNLLWLKWTGHVQESHGLRRAVEVLL